MAGGRLSDLRRDSGQGTAQSPFGYETAPRGRLQSAPRQNDHRQSIELVRQRRVLAGPVADPTSPQLTGRYEDVDSGWTLMVNQAGVHLEFWLSEVLAGDANRRQERVGIGAGDLRSDGTFGLYNPEAPGRPLGTIRQTNVDGAPGLRLQLTTPGGDVDLTFRRVSQMPVVSDAVLAHIPRDRVEIALTERTPLVTPFARWLREHLAPDRINYFLERFFSVDSSDTVGPNHDRYEIARELDNYIGEVFSMRGPHGWHYSDIPLATFCARNVLLTQRATFNDVEHNQLDWMQVVLLRMIDNIEGRRYPFTNLRTFLGLSWQVNAPERAQRRHEYHLLYTVAGLGGDVGIGLGGFIGGLKVERTSEPRWSRDYMLYFGQIGAGPGANIQMGQQNDGAGSSVLEWTPDDFPGWVSILSSGAHAGIGIGGGSGAGMMMIYGRGNLPPLAVDLTSWWSWSSEMGVGLDLLTMAWGRIYQQGQVNSRVLPPRNVTEQIDYAAQGEAAGEVHFRLGDAMLTDDARQILRVVMAKEERAFMDRGSTLVITGHTDRVDTAERNMELSRLRAFNVYQAIKDVLGNRFLVPEENTYLYWFGEEEAERAGDRDELPNERFRRVNVVINHRLVLSLRGE